jgi:hypothetical protein
MPARRRQRGGRDGLIADDLFANAPKAAGLRGMAHDVQTA